MLLPLGEAGKAGERLRRIGLTLSTLGDQVQVSAVQFGSTAQKLGLEQGFRVVSIEMPADRPAKEWMFVPALALLALVVVSQRRRVDRGGGRAAPFHGPQFRTLDHAEGPAHGAEGVRHLGTSQRPAMETHFVHGSPEVLPAAADGEIAAGVVVARETGGEAEIGRAHV